MKKVSNAVSLVLSVESCVLLMLISFADTSTAFMTKTTTPLFAKNNCHQLHYYQAKNEPNNQYSSSSSQKSMTYEFTPPSSLSPSTPPGTTSTVSRTNQLMMEQNRKNQEIAEQWDAEIKATSKDRMDRKRIDSWLEPEPEASQQAKAAKRTVAQWNDGWRVALAAGTVAGLGCEYVTHSSVLSVSFFCFVFFTALRDPNSELNEENVAGPLARIVGRSAIQSYEVTQPKIKAVARAAVRGDQDLAELKVEVQELREENAKLRSYVERRQWIDDHQSDFALEDLKILAQRFRIPYSGVPKPLLMMRLLEVGALRMR